MKINTCEIPDLLIIEPSVFEDDRGYFFEGFNSHEFKDATGVDLNIQQLNFSKSTRGVLRGLHFQNPPFAQSKLICCISGEIMDIAVDIRSGSSTYSRYEKVLLTESNYLRFYIPAGFAHGFVVLSETAEIMYAVDNQYSPDHDSGIFYNDPEINIDWEIAATELQLSTKDKNLPLLRKADNKF